MEIEDQSKENVGELELIQQELKEAIEENLTSLRDGEQHLTDARDMLHQLLIELEEFESQEVQDIDKLILELEKWIWEVKAFEDLNDQVREKIKESLVSFMRLENLLLAEKQKIN